MKVASALWCLLLISPLSLSATSHIWVLTPDGVWLASDSLLEHHDYFRGPSSYSNICKVQISRGRFLVNRGDFRSVSDLARSEQALPFADPLSTINRMIEIMQGNHQGQYPQLSGNQHSPIEDAVVIERFENKFMTGLGTVEPNLSADTPVILELKMAELFALGNQRLDKPAYRSRTNSTYQAELIMNPKLELLRLLALEAIDEPTAIGPPYTVLLLHPDGSVSDYSDTPLCEIPSDAQYHSASQSSMKRR